MQKKVKNNVGFYAFGKLVFMSLKSGCPEKLQTMLFILGNMLIPKNEQQHKPQFLFLFLPLSLCFPPWALGSSNLVDIPLTAVETLIFVTIIYWMANLARDAALYFSAVLARGAFFNVSGCWSWVRSGTSRPLAMFSCQ